MARESNYDEVFYEDIICPILEEHFTALHDLHVSGGLVNGLAFRVAAKWEQTTAAELESFPQRSIPGRWHHCWLV